MPISAAVVTVMKSHRPSKLLKVATSEAMPTKWISRGGINHLDPPLAPASLAASLPLVKVPSGLRPSLETSVAWTRSQYMNSSTESEEEQDSRGMKRKEQ